MMGVCELRVCVSDVHAPLRARVCGHRKSWCKG